MNEITIPRIVPPYPFEAYAHIISPLSAEAGGGYLITFPDLPGCMSYGETEAAPGASGKFVARVPKSIHAKLTTRAKAEGVSLNTLVLTMIAEGLGRREHHA